METPKPEKDPLEAYSVDTESIKTGKSEETAELTPDVFTPTSGVAPETETSGVDVKTPEVAAETSEAKEEARKEALKEEELEKEKTEAAKSELVDLTKGISEAREKNQKKEEASFYSRAPEVYKNATGEELAPKARERAESNLKEVGRKIMKIKDYLTPERTERTAEKVRREEQSSAILKSWNALSPEEKEKYVEGGKVNSSKFVEEFSAARKALAEKENISENTFNRITNEGFDLNSIERRGFLKQAFGYAAVEMPTLDGRGSLAFSSKKEFEEWLAEKESEAEAFIKEEAKRRINQKIIDGQIILRQEKHRCVREILKETAGKIEAEREEKKEEKEKKETEKEKEKPKIEIISRIGRARTPEQMKEMEKIRKQVETDIEKRKETKKRIDDLIKKQKKGELLTAREVAYLRSIELSRKTKE